MTAFDIIVLIPLLWGVYRGFTKGLIMQTASLLALFLGTFFAVKFSDVVANVLNLSFSVDQKFLPFVSFMITFLGVVVIILLTAKLVERFMEAAQLSTANKVGGSVLGLFKYALAISVVIFLLNCAGKNGEFFSQKTREESFMYKPVSVIATSILPMSDLKEKAELAGKELQASSKATPEQP